MIQLMIVEDEPLIRNGLLHHMPWRKLGIDSIRTAANANDALQISNTFQPDIILSDIRMPGISGIELCSQFHRRFPNSQIIFISGYSDKEYLMAAIHLGAVSYIEKPVSIAELSDAVRKATRCLHRLNQQETSCLHTLLCADAKERADALQVFPQWQQQKNLRNDKTFRVGIMKLQAKGCSTAGLAETCQTALQLQFPNQHLHFTADLAGPTSMFVLLSGSSSLHFNREKQWPEICETLLRLAGKNSPCFLGIGKSVSKLELLSDSLQSAESAVLALSYKGWNAFAFYDEPQSEWKAELPEATRSAFFKQLLCGKQEDVQKRLVQFFYKLTEDHTILNFNIKNLYYQLDCEILRAEQQYACRKDTIPQLSGSFLDRVQTLKEMHQYLSGRIQTFYAEKGEREKRNSAIQTVLNYLHTRPDDQAISIQMLAQMVYLTPTYLSNIFKKQTGMTIGQYLTKIRIEKAMEYMADPKLKLYQIASMVGYEDANYFGKLFKKQTGMLPSEYREMVS
ncbi:MULTISPECIES: response regulator transcription factor [Caproicibacterium]|uniref:Stage 0 sporulation protein A homolog n=1 Tax=Caproicibacterium argilliputei TaxID=3030016 RepID=A0AA97D7F8_9FIRM|nr:response regulator [Caproicibacterium argilliputei]WOC31729.1 response regulator [Caproicibacterium argilliputei]